MTRPRLEISPPVFRCRKSFGCRGLPNAKKPVRPDRRHNRCRSVKGSRNSESHRSNSSPQHQRPFGPRGNIAVLTGPDGKLLVDAEIITARPNVSAALASINAEPIKQLINTHWHFDHTGGNEWLHQAGASILAQENTRKHLLVATRVEGWQHTFPAAPAGAIPSTVFREEYTLRANNTTLILKHYPPAHTDSDISVHFAEADILHTGDTFWNRDYPFIDYSTGGSIDGQIRAAEANLAKVTEKTIVIPGHGAVDGKADLVLFRDVLVELRDKVAALKNRARTLAEVVAAKPGARYDAEWGNPFLKPSEFLAWCTRAFDMEHIKSSGRGSRCANLRH